MHYKKVIVTTSIVIASTISVPIALAQTPASFMLKPSQETVAAGESLILTIDMTTGGENVNSYIANIKYPDDKFTFEAINTDGSPFSMALEAKGSNGEINIIRGTSKAVSGTQLVGKASFKAKTKAEAHEIKVTEKSAIISSDNQNILPNSVVQNSNPTASNVPSSTSSTTQGSNMVLKWWNSIINFFTLIFKR